MKKAFWEIGQDKLDILKGHREGQIGYFGIGVLSIFLIADRFEVTTRRLNAEQDSIHFHVTGLDDDINFSTVNDDRIGTRIRVYPRGDGAVSLADIPEVVKQYVRHVDGVFVESVDAGTSEAVPSTWTDADLYSVREAVKLDGVREARLGFNSALKQRAGTLSSDLMICNGGFLTETTVHDLIPTPAIGLGGELDLEPHTVSIGMSRERIQRDGLWSQLGARLEQWAIGLALEELRIGELRRLPQELDSLETKRNLLLWYHFIPPQPPFSELYESIDARLFETVPFKLPERRSTSLVRLFGLETRGAKLFFKPVWQPEERTQNIDDEGMPISIRQEIRDSIRIGALRAKEYEVIELDRLQVNLRSGGTVRTQYVDEYPLVQRCLEKRGIQLIDIANASESDMDLRGIEKLPILNDALSIAGGLRFAAVTESKRRVITDRSGTRYINLRNPDVQSLLGVIPEAISNPLKSRLLEAYLKIEDFRFRDARELLSELLKSSDLETPAGLDVAPLTRQYIEAQIKRLLSELKQ